MHDESLSLTQSPSSQSSSQEPKSHKLLLQCIIYLSSIIPIIIAGVSSAFIILFSVYAYTEGYHMTNNPYLTVWISILNTILSAAVFMEIITARWWYYTPKNAKLTPLNSIRAFVYICTVAIILVLCCFTDLCYFVTWIRGEPELGSLLSWTFSVIIVTLWLILVTLRYYITVKFQSAKYYQLLSSSNPSIVFCGLRCFTMSIISFIIIAAIATLCFNNAIFRAKYTIGYSEPGTRVRLKSGPTLHIHCMGDISVDQSTVVLETDISSVSSISWKIIFIELSKHRRTCWYDRAGYGWSFLGHFPRTGNIIVDELYELLEASGELNNDKKIVLVGHRWGAQLVRLFQYKYPEVVSGLVLLDSVSENKTALESQIEKISYERLVSQKKRALLKDYMNTILEPFGFAKYTYKYQSFYSSYYEANNGVCTGMCQSGIGAASMFNNRWLMSTYSEQY
jgi:hypothetical protein